MNVEQVAGLIAYFGSAWPSWQPSDDTADVWAEELAEVSVEVGRLAAKDLVRSSTFVPSIAEFLDRCRYFANRLRLEESFASLPAAAQSEPVPTELFTELRAKLTDWSAKGHDHRGPEPCPVCSQREAEPA